MHWNVTPDALPGSVSIVRILDCWLNDCDQSIKIKKLWNEVGMAGLKSSQTKIAGMITYK